MARKVRFGVVRDGEHLSLHDHKANAEHAANKERAWVQQSASNGWTTDKAANRTHVWVEEVRGYVW